MLQLFRVDNANEYLLYCRQLAGPVKIYAQIYLQAPAE